MTYEEIQKAVGNAAAIFKLVCGVGNNAAWVVMMEGYDHARRCKAFRRSLKGGHSVGWYFKKAVRDFNDYERNLLTSAMPSTTSFGRALVVWLTSAPNR